MKPYCQVIVDITAESVDKLFTYSIPDGMHLVPGQRVLVPFGRQRLEGFVISLQDSTDVPPERLKPVLQPMEDYPALLPEILELAQWICVKYRCRLCEALRLMIPAEMRGSRIAPKVLHIARLVRPVTEEDRELLRRAPKQLEALLALSESPKPTAVLNASFPGAVRGLTEKGLVVVEEEEEFRRPHNGQNDVLRTDFPLKAGQQAAFDALCTAMHSGGGRFLLHGVTGSGKTEVYIHLIREALSRGKNAIVLVPEISLTPQMVDWFRGRFGDNAAVLHSRLSAGERFDEWRRIRMGGAQVVIGARSAIFAPLENIGVIIVDEEHEHTYLSEHRPRYDAREIAWHRALASGAVLLLGSATPSIASYMRTMPGVRPENRLTLLEMLTRVNDRPLPTVDIVNMAQEFVQGNNSVFSAKLQTALRECVASGNQAMLLMNRRGYNTFVSCRSCGYVEKCSQCDMPMTYHMAESIMKCHYCGETHIPPTVCPQCGSRYIRYFGAGTQKIEEELHKLLPGVPVGRMDNDTTRGKDAHARILGEFRRGETKVLVGTQMIAKGLDFPKVTLVGVVAADLTLNVPDYRSAERTFQLLTQAAGRAGRAQGTGHVIVQTYNVENYAIRLAAKQDYRAFYHQEVDYRRRNLYPPFTILVRILATAKDQQMAALVIQGMEEKIRLWLQENPELRKDIIKLHARPAPIAKLRGEFRHQIFMRIFAKGASDTILAMLEQLCEEEYDQVRVELEVNPVNLM